VGGTGQDFWEDFDQTQINLCSLDEAQEVKLVDLLNVNKTRVRWSLRLIA